MQKKDKKIEIILFESVESGKSSYETAKQLDMAPTTVRRWAKKQGLTFKGRFSANNNLRKGRVNKLWNK
jgi:hypothetical protein